jgi:hypothetical protein
VSKCVCVCVCVYVRVYVCVCVCGMRKKYIINEGMLEGGCKCVCVCMCVRESEREGEREEKVSASKIFQSVCGNHVCRHLFKSQFAFLIKR